MLVYGILKRKRLSEFGILFPPDLISLQFKKDYGHIIITILENSLPDVYKFSRAGNDN